MAAEWKTARIEELAEKVAIGPFGSSIKIETFVPNGIPVISGQHLRGTRVEDNGHNFISIEHADKLKNSNVFRGDVIFTHAGNIGQTAYIPETSKYERYIISQRQFYMRCNRSIILPEFVTRYFKTPEGQHKLLANASSVGVPSIARPVSYLRTIEIPVPPLHEQEVITQIFDSLDDKIELNRRMNETLEALAQSLFKSWFVDATQSALPKGWREVPLPEAIEVNPPRPLRKGEVAPYLDMANMPTRSARALEVVNREFGSGMRFKNGDTLVARITPCLENGKTCYVDFLNDGQIAWGSTEYIVLQPKPPLPPEFAYFLARTEEFRAFMISNMTGTSGRQRVPAECLSNFKVAVPPAELAEKFGKFASATFAQMKAHDEESRTLAALRDALLPKLLSGEIRVRDLQTSGAGRA